MSVAKAAVAFLIAALTALAAALTDGVVQAEEWVQFAIAIATAAGVWVTANVPSMPAAKTFIAGVLAALNLAVTYITGGISHAEWINLALAFLGVFAVYAVPNKGDVRLAA